MQREKLIDELKCYQGKTLVLCVSCGVDSMVLLDLFRNINCQIIVAHVNHHMRKDSDIEQQFLINYCKDANISLAIKELHFTTTSNFQEEARNLRYHFFKECVKKYHADYLVTAHHANDDLETIIMRLIKGSSLKGYAGIEKEQDLKDYKIIRPLLNVTKQEIIDYAKAYQVPYFEDSSNAENHYLRNRIRHNIIPLMEQENPSLYKEISEFKYHIEAMNDLLFTIINKFEATKIVHDTYITYELSDYLAYNDYLKEQILFDLLKPISPSKNLIHELLKQITGPKPIIINNLTNDFYMIKEYGKLGFGTICQKDSINVVIEEDGTYKIGDDIQISVTKNKCYFKDKTHEVCYNIDNLPITIRGRKNGDKIKVKNHIISLSDYYTNHKTSHFLRNRLVLVDSSNIVISILP